MAKIGIYKEPDTSITRYLERTFKTWLMHWHREVEIVHVIEGPCTFVVGKKSYVGNSGDFIITRGCEPHQFVTPIFKKMQICKFNIGLIYGITKKFQYPKSFISSDEIALIPGLYDELCSVFDKLGKIYNEGGSNIIADCYTILLFNLLAENFPDKTENSSYDSESLLNLQVILDYIDKNYAHAITLQTLAEKINYSDSYVSLLFSKYSGMSYKEYIDRVRISKATELIRRGGKTFTEISVLCGYDTIRTFNNVFKRIMDCTPTEYKTEQTKNNHIINEDEC